MIDFDASSVSIVGPDAAHTAEAKTEARRIPKTSQSLPHLQCGGSTFKTSGESSARSNPQEASGSTSCIGAEQKGAAGENMRLGDGWCQI